MPPGEKKDKAWNKFMQRKDHAFNENRKRADRFWKGIGDGIERGAKRHHEWVMTGMKTDTQRMKLLQEHRTARTLSRHGMNVQRAKYGLGTPFEETLKGIVPPLANGATQVLSQMTGAGVFTPRAPVSPASTSLIGPPPSASTPYNHAGIGASQKPSTASGGGNPLNFNPSQIVPYVLGFVALLAAGLIFSSNNSKNRK